MDVCVCVHLLCSSPALSNKMHACNSVFTSFPGFDPSSFLLLLSSYIFFIRLRDKCCLEGFAHTRQVCISVRLFGIALVFARGSLHVCPGVTSNTSSRCCHSNQSCLGLFFQRLSQKVFILLSIG